MDGSYRLDGGGMFAVVPRVLWERRHRPDARNRVQLALRSLLARRDDRVVLVDCGMGGGWSRRDGEIYALERPEGGLVAALRERGIAPAQVTDVILTHLHFDHVGGAWDPLAQAGVFPEAVHWIQTVQRRWAEDPTERDRGSFRRERWQGLLDGERWREIDGAAELLPGLRVVPVHGHTPGQQMVVLEQEGGDTLLFAGDLVPYASHLRTAWTCAFDLNPLLTLQEKKDHLARAAAEGWTVVFCHDMEVPAARIRAVDGGWEVAEEVAL
jgi:glyoxylase-like metal-dependent hydrolase (beta-lactamase superfamily II)